MPELDSFFQSDVRNNFDKADTGETTAFDVPYDYGMKKFI